MVYIFCVNVYFLTSENVLVLLKLLWSCCNYINYNIIVFKTWPKNLNNNSEYKYLLFCYWKDLSILFQNLNSFKGLSTPLGWDLHRSPNFSYLEVRNSSTDSNWKWQKKGSILGGKSTFKYIHCTAEIDNQIWRYEQITMVWNYHVMNHLKK